MRNVLVTLMLLPFCGLAAAQHPGASVKYATDIPSQRLERALETFARERSLQLVYATNEVRNLTSGAAKGQLTADEALARILRGTGLAYRFVDEKTVTVELAHASVPAGAMSSPSGANAASDGAGEQLRLVDSAGAAASADTAPGAIDEQPIRPEVAPADELTITGSRIRGMAGEAGANPVLVYTREDIARSGAGTLADFKQLIPQLSVGSRDARGNGVTGGEEPRARVTMNLRGLGNNSTLVLVNGRRLAKNAQNNSADDYDLTGIPLSAIERIEVLMGNASAVYGADAIGGVVNIILRTDYSGTEVSMLYDNTFDSDAAMLRTAITSGYRSERSSLLVSASYERQNPLGNRDRHWLSSLDLTPYGGEDETLWQPPAEGIVSSEDGEALPGLQSSSVRIPAGSNGRTLTIADFAAAGPIPPGFDYPAYFDAINPSNKLALTASAQYRWRPWLEWFADARWNEFHNRGTTLPPSISVTLPADYIGNPFGVPVVVDKYLWELGLAEQSYVSRSPALVTGIRGALGKLQTWRYESSLSLAQTFTDLDWPYVQTNFARLSSAIDNPDPAQRPVLLNDSLSGAANPPGLLESWFIGEPEREDSRSYTADAKADGELMQLPAGAVRMAVGMEYRDEGVSFRSNNATYSTTLAVSRTRDHSNRYSGAGFVELAVPLISPQQDVWAGRALELQLAGRHDEYSDFGSATTYRAGLLYKPVDPLTLRASRGDGFKVPMLAQLYAPITNQPLYLPPGFLFDPVRGEAIAVPVMTVQGGDPTLRPERSVSTNVGAVLDLPFLPGLSLSVDYWDIDVRDRIGSVNLNEWITVFPERAVRGPSSGGLPGPVIQLDIRPTNIATFRTSGFDYRLKWLETTRAGVVTLEATATRTTRYELRALPDAPVSTQAFLGSRPMRGVGSLTLERGAWQAGVTAIYQEAYRGSFSSAPMPASVLWNVQGACDLTQALSSESGWLAKALHGVQLSVSIQNLFDREPGFNGSYFDSAIDPRLRRYVLNLRKAFGP